VACLERSALVCPLCVECAAVAFVCVLACASYTDTVRGACASYAGTVRGVCLWCDVSSYVLWPLWPAVRGVCVGGSDIFKLYYIE